MAFIAMVGGVHAQIVGRWDGQETINNLYFQTDNLADPTAEQVFALAQLLDSWYAGSVLPNLAQDFVYLYTQVRAINVGFGYQFFVDASSTGGSVEGEAVPNNVDPCISFRTGVAGRFSRGRNYIPGLPNSMVDGNQLSTAWTGPVAAAYNELTAGGAHDPDPFNWVVASFYSAGVPRGSALATPIIQALFTDNIVDSQRRRLPGRGR